MPALPEHGVRRPAAGAVPETGAGSSRKALTLGAAGCRKTLGERFLIPYDLILAYDLSRP